MDQYISVYKYCRIKKKRFFCLGLLKEDRIFELSRDDIRRLEFRIISGKSDIRRMTLGWRSLKGGLAIRGLQQIMGKTKIALVKYAPMVMCLKF